MNRDDSQQMSQEKTQDDAKRIYRRYDWAALKRRFLVGALTIQEFAAQEGIERTIVARRASQDGWMAERDKIDRQVTRGVVAKSVQVRIRTESEIDGRAHKGAVRLATVIARLIRDAEGLTLDDATRLKAAVEALEKAHRLARITAHLPPEPVPVIDGFDATNLSPDEVRLLKKLVEKASGSIAGNKVH